MVYILYGGHYLVGTFAPLLIRRYPSEDHIPTANSTLCVQTYIHETAALTAQMVHLRLERVRWWSCRAAIQCRPDKLTGGTARTDFLELPSRLPPEMAEQRDQ